MLFSPNKLIISLAVSQVSIGINDKTFFGSKVLNLKNSEIILSKWNYNLVKNENTAKFNISKHNENSKPKTVLEI